MKTKVCIYARVSTSAQDYSHQLSSLRSYAKKQNYEVVKEFSEKISGAKKIADRQAMTELLDYVKENKVEKVLIYECSRLSRRQLDFLSIIEQLTEMGISLFILQNGLETLLPDGKVNPIASLVCGIISEFNSLERNLIRSRMKVGYDHARSIGVKVGRKTGFRKDETSYREQYSKEIGLLAKNVTLRDCHKLTGTSINTLRKLKDRFLK